MTITGSTFDRMRVTPDKDGLLYYSLYEGINRVINGYKNNLNLVVSGLNVSVDTGAAVIKGRLVEVTELHKLTVAANTSGYIVLTIDLTQQNTSTGTPGSTDYLPINNQVSVQVVDSLVQQDLLNGGLIYMFPLASYTSTGTTVSTTKMGEFAYICPFSAGWSSYYEWDKGILAYDMGDFVVLDGLAKNASTISANGVSEICSLPEGLEPIALQEITRFKGLGHWNLVISAGGKLTLNYYTEKGIAAAYSSGSWTSLAGVMFMKKRAIRAFK